MQMPIMPEKKAFATMSDLNLFIPITKIDAAKRLVYGVATAESEDRSGEICDYASTKPNYEKWSAEIGKASAGKSFGNLRAMHGNIAAGKLTSISFNDDAKQIEICAKVVDDGEWRKVEEGVYTGFSQGGRYAKRWQDDAGLQRYTAEPSEVSLVDLPCLPSATFKMIKADGAIEMRSFRMTVQHGAAEIGKQAEELAKAAGRPDAWPEFLTQARAALEKEAEKHQAPKAKVQDGHDGQDGHHADAKVDNPDTGWKVHSTDKDGKDHETAHASKGAAEEEVERRKKDGHSDVRMTVGKAAGTDADLAKGSSPIDDEQWEQVWKSKRDGATFRTKAELRKHLSELDAAEAVAPATAPVLDTLAELQSALGLAAGAQETVAKGGDEPGDGKTPYGDEDYADPGYQKDKQKRYPLTEDGKPNQKRIRAAWAYINKPKNAKPYNAADLDKIKAKIIAAWKNTIDKAGPPAAQKKAMTADDLAKGLPTVAGLAYIVQSLNSLLSSVIFETKEEGDDSPVAAKLKQNVADLCDTLNEMCAEETAELIDGQDVDELGMGSPLYMAAGLVPMKHLQSLAKILEGADGGKLSTALLKSGARNSKVDMDKIQAMHDNAVDLGAQCDGGDDDMDGKGHMHGDLAKISGALAKMTAERDALTKAVTEIKPQLDEVLKRVKNIESQPLPLPFGGPGRAVSKGQDNGAGADLSAEEELAKMMASPEGREKAQLMLIKLAQQTPQMMTPAR